MISLTTLSDTLNSCTVRVGCSFRRGFPMKKKSFLAPLAVSVAALLSVPAAQAAQTPQDVRIERAKDVSAPTPVADDFVIERSQPTVDRKSTRLNSSH